MSSAASASQRPVDDVEDHIVDDVEDHIDDAAEAVEDALADRPWLVVAVRAGWVAKAATYATIGWAGLEIAMLSRPGAEAAYTGLLVELGKAPRTQLMLGAMAFGHLLYMTYRLLTIVLIDDHGLDAWAHRAAYLVSALAYGALGTVAATTAVSGDNLPDGSVLETTSHWMLGSTAGRIALASGAAVAVLAGLFSCTKDSPGGSWPTSTRSGRRHGVDGSCDGAGRLGGADGACW